MAELKTRPTGASVDDFLATVEDEARRADCRTLEEMMVHVTGAKAVMWGSAIVGFGSYHYRYSSGREGEWMLTGFSPRRRELVLYIMTGFAQAQEALARLGPHRRSTGSCLYLKRLGDVDLAALDELVRTSVDRLRVQGASH